MAAASGNTLLLDENNQPLTNILSWLDERCVGTSRDPLPGFDFDNVHRIVGWPWTESFPLAHIPWLRKHRPDTYEKAARFCMNSDYLLYRLTGRFGMDPSTATTFYFQDQVNRCWYGPYLEYLDIKEDHLSVLAPSGTALGPLTWEGARDTGLTEDTLVVLGTFDHPSAARGTGVIETGHLLLSCGTSWVGFYPINDRDLALAQNLLIDPFLSPEGPWGTMFSLPRIAVVMDWLVDNLVADGRPDKANKFAAFDQAAMKAPRGANELFMNPFDDVRDQPDRVDELRNRYGVQDISRAIMEGAAFEMRKRIEELAEAGIEARVVTMVGGPTESPIWPRIVAEVTGLELRLINGQTAGAIGAALLAGIGADLFKDEHDAFASMGWKPQLIVPDKTAAEAYTRLYRAYLKHRAATNPLE